MRLPVGQVALAAMIALTRSRPSTRKCELQSFVQVHAAQRCWGCGSPMQKALANDGRKRLNYGVRSQTRAS